MPSIPLHQQLDLVQCIYIEGKWTPQSIKTQMPCIPLHPLVDLVQCIYIGGRWTPQSIKHRCLAYLYTHWQIQYNAYIQKADGPPSQSNIDALHTSTPTGRSSTMHIYRRQMDHQVNQVQMPCTPLHLLLALDPQSIKHRCLAYCYTHWQIQCNAYIQKANGPPSQSRRDALHTATTTPRCSTMHIYIEGKWTPSQSGIDALCTTTPTARSSTMHIYKEGRWTPQ